MRLAILLLAVAALLIAMPFLLEDVGIRPAEAFDLRETRFVITNEAPLPVWDVYTDCGIERVQFLSGDAIADANFVPRPIGASALGAGESVDVECSLRELVTWSSEIDRVVYFVQAKYRLAPEWLPFGGLYESARERRFVAWRDRDGTFDLSRLDDALD